MRFATLVAADRKAYFCRVDGDLAHPLALAYEKPGLDPLRQLLASGKDPKRVRAIRKPFPLKGAKHKPVVTAPQKIIAIGLNYRNHARETGMQVPPVPMSWCKYTSSLLGHGETIRYRKADSAQVDYEIELAFVIGRRARNVPAERALRHVFGYTICNDVTARDEQFAEGQFCRAKSFDTFTPLGPWIVDAAEIGDPQNLRLRTRVNGEVVQDESTADMIFPCADIVAYLSRYMTLEPGDVVATGTPAGVGFKRNPPVYLLDGAVVECEIERIGILRNRVRAR
jgi:2-keto-4-pentenoate hydratase/2-oxohepta-3-ene-1,7-dioic acid hydratase in catechol pathway